MATAGAAPTDAIISTFVDTSGDAGTAPDVTRVLTDGDDSGVISIAVEFPGLRTLPGPNDIDTFLNTDQSLATGYPPDGSDCFIAAYGEQAPAPA